MRWLDPIRALANSDLVVFDEPEMALDRLRVQKREHLCEYLNEVSSRLASEAQDNEPRVLSGWVSPDIREIEVEGD